jgi:hypothetical protein
MERADTVPAECGVVNIAEMRIFILILVFGVI